MHLLSYLFCSCPFQSCASCWVFTWTFWPPSLYCSISLQIWYLDFCHRWFLHLTAEEDIIPVDQCDPRGIQPSWCGLHLHSCPVPPRFSTALYSEVRLFKPSSWSYFITTKTQFVPWVCISFLQLKPSETQNKFGPEDFLVTNTEEWQHLFQERHWTIPHNLKWLKFMKCLGSYPGHWILFFSLQVYSSLLNRKQIFWPADIGIKTKAQWTHNIFGITQEPELFTQI